jgi:uncharacterized protein (DUF3084 family)
VRRDGGDIVKSSHDFLFSSQQPMGISPSENLNRLACVSKHKQGNLVSQAKQLKSQARRLGIASKAIEIISKAIQIASKAIENRLRDLENRLRRVAKSSQTIF